jgi:hypothetical protein
MPARRPARARHIRRITQRLSSAGGFALPTTMLMLLAAFATVSVGVAATIQVQHGTIRDRGTKAALQMAQTGVSQAIYQFNTIPPSPTNPCSPVTASGPQADGWCPPVGPFTDTSGGTFTYQAHPYATGSNKALDVVATGQFGNATRRILVSAKSLDQNIFQDAQVKTANGIIMDSNAAIHTAAATNGNMTLGSNAKQCGQASVGIGRQMILNGNAGYFSDNTCANPSNSVNQQELILPTVNQGDAATNNDNGRLFSQDLISGNKNSACFNGHDGNNQSDNSCGPRELFIGSNTAVTLTGGTYSFCSLTLRSNTSLYIAPGHTVSIYFDSPEACGYTGTGTVTQLDMSSNSRITSTDGTPANAALLFVGSTTRSTQILLSSNTAQGTTCQQNFVIYAPLSDVEMNSNSTYCGAIGAKTLHMDSNADLKADADLTKLLLPPINPHYSNPQFLECNTHAGTSPTSGC